MQQKSCASPWVYIRLIARTGVSWHDCGSLELLLICSVRNFRKAYPHHRLGNLILNRLHGQVHHFFLRANDTITVLAKTKFRADLSLRRNISRSIFHHDLLSDDNFEILSSLFCTSLISLPSLLLHISALRLGIQMTSHFFFFAYETLHQEIDSPGAMQHAREWMEENQTLQ